MKLSVTHQEEYSRGELLLRTFFGWLYIMIPHMAILFFLAIGLSVVHFLSTILIVATGKYPRGLFDYTLGVFRWLGRLHTRVYNMSDGYPGFGLDQEDEFFKMEVEYPEQVSRGITLLRFFLGSFYVGLPHGIILIVRQLINNVITFLAFWAVLFTGKYPQSWFNFSVDTLRWMMRVNVYLYHMTDVYPPFTGKELIKDEDKPLDQF